jgi:predicted RNase H-like nuclease
MNEAAFGIDIGSGAWAVVELTAPRAEGRVQLAATRVAFDSILDCVQPGKTVIIDVPIGLFDDEDASPTDRGKSGDRDVDKGARKWCQSTSSVFPPPTKQQLVSSLAEHRRARSGQDQGGVEATSIQRRTRRYISANVRAGPGDRCRTEAEGGVPRARVRGTSRSRLLGAC